MFIRLKIHKKQICDTDNIHQFKLVSESEQRKEHELLLMMDVVDKDDDHRDDLMIHIS